MPARTREAICFTQNPPLLQMAAGFSVELQTIRRRGLGEPACYGVDESTRKVISGKG
jgi:hypothetical protein